MPRHCYTGAPYGCGHTHEHSIAAKKGWLTRRGLGPAAAREREQKILSQVYGEEVTRLHDHKSHPGEKRFKIGEEWYTVSHSDYKDLIKTGKALQKEQESAAKAEARRLDREKAGEPIRAASARLSELRNRDAWGRIAEQEQLDIYTNARKHLRKLGIRPSNVATRSIEVTRSRRGQNRNDVTYRRTVPVDYAEWQMIPKDLRRKNGRLHLDSIATELESLGILNTTQGQSFTVADSIEYIEKIDTYRANVSKARKEREYDIKEAQAELKALRAAAGKQRGNGNGRKAA